MSDVGFDVREGGGEQRGEIRVSQMLIRCKELVANRIHDGGVHVSACMFVGVCCFHRRLLSQSDSGDKNHMQFMQHHLHTTPLPRGS